MSGNHSRNKGRRNEYLLRDRLRMEGFVADRVPLSGAAQGFKGDIRFSKLGKTYYAEVKSRKASFESVYRLYDSCVRELGDDKVQVVIDGVLVTISPSVTEALSPAGTYTMISHLQVAAKEKRAIRRLLKLRELLQGSDVLAIRDDNKSFLFIQYQ